MPLYAVDGGAAHPDEARPVALRAVRGAHELRGGHCAGGDGEASVVAHDEQSAPSAHDAAVSTGRKSSTQFGPDRRKTEKRERQRAARTTLQKCVAEYLTRARVQHGLSIEDCAEEAGMSATAWRKYETAQTPVDSAAVVTASVPLFLTWSALVSSDVLRERPKLDAAESLPFIAQIVGRVGKVLVDKAIAPHERPEAMAIGEALHEVGNAWQAAGRGEGSKG